jgi:hypothetical protein
MKKCSTEDKGRDAGKLETQRYIRWLAASRATPYIAVIRLDVLAVRSRPQNEHRCGADIAERKIRRCPNQIDAQVLIFRDIVAARGLSMRS